MELLEKRDLNNPNLLIGKYFEIAEKVEGKSRIAGPMKAVGIMYEDDRGFLYTRGIMGSTTVGKYFASDRPDRDLLREVLKK